MFDRVIKMLNSWSLVDVFDICASDFRLTRMCFIFITDPLLCECLMCIQTVSNVQL